MVYQFAQLSREEIEVMLNLRLEDTRVYREAREEGLVEGRQLEAVQLVVRQLERRLGQELPEGVRTKIAQLSLPVLESLGEALLDFSALADLEAWLREDR
jgi:predicted transposase YdaD